MTDAGVSYENPSRAKGHVTMVRCKACRGTGRAFGAACKVCDGTGKVPAPPLDPCADAISKARREEREAAKQALNEIQVCLDKAFRRLR